MTDTAPVLVKARTWGDMLRDAGVRSYAMIAGAAVITFCGAGLTLIIWLGPWSPDRQQQQLYYLGTALLGCLLIVALVMIALTGVSVAVSASRKGVSVNVSDEDGNKPLATVTTTTQIERGDGHDDGPYRRDPRDERHQRDRPGQGRPAPWER